MVRWDDKILRLVKKDGECALRIDNKRAAHGLDVGLPCYFQRDNAELQIFSFLEFDNVSVAVVAGEMINSKTRKDYNLEKDEICLKNAQGLILRPDDIEITDRVAMDGLWCRDIGMDKKFFHGFAAAHHDDIEQ